MNTEISNEELKAAYKTVVRIAKKHGMEMDTSFIRVRNFIANEMMKRLTQED